MSEQNDRERRVDEAVAWYYRQLEAGTRPDADAFLGRFPDVRDDLVSFLADKAAFEQAARPADPDVTVTLDQTGREPQLPDRIRYFGDYELVEEITRGGMGVVFKARQVSLNRTVAVKMILAGELASAGEVARFKAEAEAAANLQHPNIVAIHEVGEHEGQHYFSMDYVEGQNLAGLVAGNPLPAHRAARYLKTTAEAIHFAHQQGILHRDLKPSNVLIDVFDQAR